ncbi:integral membrane protein [Macrophomina phaseolina MS6]|uniref:Integral membrane protein n=1 Tax=Macrophomina phaseolina (strain MS6) TaxID=1126212 RepID=K2QV99_MACPH|nr:integral membrane protein [Macrophomina phaseolina MS6]
MDLTRLYVAQSSLNICSDLLVILLPVPAISSLKMSGKERYALIGIFALGSFGCITTVVRLIYVIRNSDSRDATWNNIEPITWSALEVFVAITCASLPALRKALQRMFPRFLHSTGYPSTTRPSGQDAHLPFTDNLSTAGRKSIRLDALRTSQKDGEIVAAARSVSKDDAGTWSDQQLENMEAQSLSESERNLFRR